jgi:hypothetical protein
VSKKGFLIGEKMTEQYVPPSDPELERARAFAAVIEQYLPDDTEFILGLDEDEALNYVWGMLLEVGEDPEVVLKEYGVIEEGEDEV